MRLFLVLVLLSAGCAPRDGSPDKAAAPESLGTRVSTAGAPAETVKRSTLVTAPHEPAHAEAEPFWREFREAALSSETDRVMSLTRFPVSARGELESDPIIEYHRQEFPPVFTRLLNQYEHTSLRDSISMLELIRKTPILNATHFNGEVEHFRVGAFYFGNADGSWRLHEVYEAER